MRTRFALVVGLLVCYVGVASAQVREEWVAPRSFQSPSAVDSAGNVYVTGWVCVAESGDEVGGYYCFDSDYITIKYDTTGNQL